MHIVQLVSSEECPNWLYTIGAFETTGHEYLLAGNVELEADPAHRLVNEVVAAKESGEPLPDGVALRKVTGEWAEKLTLLIDPMHRPYVQQIIVADASALQARCDRDFPKVGESTWALSYDEPWPFATPLPSWVAVSKGILAGESPVQCYRWEPGYWELFDVPSDEVEKEDVRIVSLSCLIDLGHDVEKLISMPILVARDG